MKKSVLFVSIAICLQSCYSYRDIFQVIPEGTANEIPLNAKKVIIKNDNTLEDNYNKSYKVLLSQDYMIEKDNKDMGYISASKKDFGDTYVRLNVTCSNGSIAVTSQWKAGSQTSIMASALTGMTVNYDWENAQWNKRADKPSIAFAKAVIFSKELSNNLDYMTY
jgi:hypothetical protein